uniref:Polyprenol dehydrogenase n=1 Tax=Zonotrichia albicollis TaxID=44394 RepID=A0A8D2QHJ4_ZONAL
MCKEGGGCSFLWSTGQQPWGQEEEGQQGGGKHGDPLKPQSSDVLAKTILETATVQRLPQLGKSGSSLKRNRTVRAHPFLYCDLASMKSIRRFVQQFRAKNCPLHVLVNNAGVMLVPERKTEDGFEEHFGLNYLGHFLLTNLLLDTLKQSGTHSHSARIITVSSATHYVGKLHLNDLQSRYLPLFAYAQSKLALVLFTYRLQHLLTANGSHVTANVVDPGVVNTELYQHVFWVVKVVKWMTAWLFFKSPEEGASTTIYAAVSPEMEGAGGCYLYNEERTKSADVAYDEELQRRLWTESCKMVGISDEAGRLP